MTNTLGKNPLMKKHEIRAIEKALLSFRKDKLEVLEWGSGGSTHYFTKFLKDKEVLYSWTSIEYNKEWFEKISKEVEDDQDIHMHLFDVGNVGLKQRDTDMEDYINFPKTLGKKFDLILVDGRKRRRCVLESKNLLSKSGMVFLHDAQRKHYQCVFSEFTDSKMVGPYLWRGRMAVISVISRWFNNLRFILFSLMFKVIIRPWQVLKEVL